MMQEDAEDETAFLFSVIFSEFSCKWVEGWGISHESPIQTGISIRANRTPKSHRRPPEHLGALTRLKLARAAAWNLGEPS